MKTGNMGEQNGSWLRAKFDEWFENVATAGRAVK